MGYEAKNAIDNKSNNPFIIIYLAQFHKHKRHLWLIKALQPILTKYDDIKLYLPGDGNMLSECRKFVQNKDLIEKVILPGWTEKDELNKVMQKANLGIVTTKSETFGHNIIEPMFYRMPVISTPVGIAPDIITNGVNGFLFSHFDSDDLRNKVRFFYNNREKSIEYGKNAYEIAMSQLTWNTIAKKYRDYILSLV